MKSTVVPLSMKISRSTASPEFKCTGQLTCSTNAWLRAAANAAIVPLVWSAVLPQFTQSLIGRLPEATAGAAAPYNNSAASAAGTVPRFNAR